MLGFFRRIINSRVGIIVTFAVLILIALAFAAGDVTGLRSTSGTMSGTSVARVGGASIGTAELRRSVQDELQAARQQQPAMDIAQFVAQGGFDAVLQRQISGLAFEEFGHDQGMVIGKNLVDGQIASIPSLQGLNGKFDQSLYNRLLAERRLTDAGVRTDIARGMIAQQLVAPTVGATQVPMQVALPYSSLLLEKRSGQIGLIPTQAVGQGATPTDAELQGWYKRNIARYSLPERRIVRYALVTPEFVKARAVPTAAEIAQAYAGASGKYRPTERRTITQITVLDQSAANGLAAKIKAGAAIGEAARAAGLEPRTVISVDKAGYANQSSTAAADAAFAAARGGVIGPVRGTIGFIVARVDAIEQDPGKTLAQAQGEITAALAQQKTAAALAAVQDALGDALDKDANFTEIVAEQKLQARATPALTASGIDPQNPAAKPDPSLGQIVAAGYAAAEGDAPVIVQTAADGSFALVGLDKIIAAAPRPLADVRNDVARDFVIDRAKKASRQIAASVVAQIGKGVPIEKALADTKLKLPPIRPVTAPRSQLTANRQGAPAPLVLLFSMAPNTAKLLEAPNNGGWIIVKLDTIVSGDASKLPELVKATRGELGKVIGREYAEQFTTAVRRAVKVKQNDAAIASVKADLTGQGGSDQ